jgi:hypothetical protein
MAMTLDQQVSKLLDNELELTTNLQRLDQLIAWVSAQPSGNLDLGLELNGISVVSVRVARDATLTLLTDARNRTQTRLTSVQSKLAAIAAALV